MWESKIGASAFWALVDKSTPTGCWIWTGCKTAGGYGRMGSEYAHRRSAEMAGMKIPRGHFVCHNCDTRACVNPKHLFIGTALDNIRDMISKDRGPRGERSGTSKLTATDVRAIRAATGLQREIAEKFGITQGIVSSIKSRLRWRHVK